MASPSGTSFSTPAVSATRVSLTDASGYALFGDCTGSPDTTASIYQHGCIIISSDTGTGANGVYQNTGSIAVPSWSLFDTGTSFSLPTSATDSTSTTGDSFLLTESSLTTGNGIRVLGTTANFTTGGVLVKADMAAATAGNAFFGVTTGAYTGTGLLKLTAASGTTGTLALLTGGGAALTSAANLVDIVMGAATAGTALRIVTTGVYATGSNGLITLTANSATTTTGLLQISATGLTSGTVSLITGGGANLLTSGIVESIVMGAATVGSGVKISNTGAYTDTAAAILNIVASTASTTGNVLGITTISSRAVMVGQALATPAFQVDASTASQIAGLKVTGAATGGTVAVAAIDSGSAASVTLDGKGAGTVGIGNTSTGEVSLSRGARKSLIVGGTVTTGNAQNVTPTAAQLLGGQYKHTTQTAGGTFTLDTGTNISSAVTGVAVGDTFTCLYINNGNQTGTITTAASGTTLFGTAAVTTGKTALLTFSNTGSNTWDVYITVSA